MVVMICILWDDMTHYGTMDVPGGATFTIGQWVAYFMQCTIGLWM